MRPPRRWTLVATTLSALLAFACGGEHGPTELQGRNLPPGNTTQDASSTPPSEDGEPDASSAEPEDGGSMEVVVDAGSKVDAGPADAGNTCPRAKAMTETLNVRELANTSSMVVGTLMDGDVVNVVARVNGESVDGIAEWYKVDLGGTQGHISGAFSSCTTDPANK